MSRPTTHRSLHRSVSAACLLLTGMLVGHALREATAQTVPAPATPTTNLLEVVGMGMDAKLRNAVVRAVETQGPVGAEINLTMRTNMLASIGNSIDALLAATPVAFSTPQWDDSGSLVPARRATLGDVIGPTISARLKEDAKTAARSVLDPFIVDADGDGTFDLSMTVAISAAVSSAGQESLASQLRRYMCIYDPGTGMTRWYDPQSATFGDPCAI